jgi:hypothetical protein
MLHAGNHGPTPSTIFVPLTDGTRFTIRDTYSETQSKAVIVRRASTFLIRASLSSHNKALIVASCVSLVATVGLLSAIAVRPEFGDIS